MRISYVGSRDKFYAGQRGAELSYTNEESRRVEKLIDIMHDRGWDIDIGVEEWGFCPVEDRDEYDLFMEDWKEAKRMV